ncbi:signal recognition particle-docking protein FtsY [Mesorhizobium qingshengii]|uniref:Signal recognition particle receptor FtsY n=1 Tax=Mesorhizobium qingshengii TaxID=1165689 RepID=A0ABT4QRA6_9HYPH|nr:signal recognition particle-docking protein FtsY [Mesorhizobium qingshengii]MCZ8544106.1 signal recognition particle-docking protein FtsY [Mesorhizobium qingshengii]
MAGFFKKIFSFGKKEVVEERIDETAPLPPIKWEALDALKPAAEQVVPEFLKRDEAVPEAEVVPAPPAEPEIQPEPTPIEEPQAPEPPAPAIPAEEPAPPEEPDVPAVPERVPEPAPQEIPVPGPELPEIVPDEPPEPAPVEVPAPPIEVPPTIPSARPPSSEVGAGEGQREPAKDLAPPAAPAPHPPLDGEGRRGAAGWGDSADADHPQPRAALGTSPIEGEIKRTQPEAEPASVEPQPIIAKIAPEPQPVPPPEPKPAPGKVTVTKKVEQKAEQQKAPEPAPRRSWFQRMKDGLARSSKELTGNIAGVFTKRKLDEETLQDLEDVLIRADLGMETALRVTDALASSRYGKDVSDAEVRAIMAAEVEKVLTHVAMPLELDLSHKPHVILVVGVNGTGKTTTIGKLAAKLTDGGLSVMLAAGDTFRAAAIEQLKIWGERTKSPVIASKIGADAAGLAYDAFEKAKEAGSDVLIIDTAGRLQNKTELMAELEKIVRVLGKLDPEAPHTVLQTVDATTGQNALNQVEIFRNVAGVNGLVMTKLDGTARGGILVAIAAKHKLPVYFIGVGEQVDDLEPFSASEFARAIAGVA